MFLKCYVSNGARTLLKSSVSLTTQITAGTGRILAGEFSLVVFVHKIIFQLFDFGK